MNTRRKKMNTRRKKTYKNNYVNKKTAKSRGGAAMRRGKQGNARLNATNPYNSTYPKSVRIGNKMCIISKWKQGKWDCTPQNGGYIKPRRRHNHRGGYHVPGSNTPNTPSYSSGGVLPGGLSALANPAPYIRTNNCIPNDFPIRH